MKTKFITTVVSLSLLAATAQAQQAGQNSQTITRAGSQPATKGPAENFTDSVTVTPLFPATATAPYSGGSVAFEAGARSAWHTHPFGQRLMVTAGVGRTGVWGSPVREIRAGDVVWCPPGVKHWHGAAPNSAMTHIALTVNDKGVNWLEKVTEGPYNMTPTQTENTSAAPAQAT